ncbi:MAG TPA: twin-arginine translocase subunit TatC [Candidatus Limnocylindrales bacterium]|jgi:sec-independent protein translocase protein TatC|nr:twin-arginine translocase subunit TatC [Candidatus Limnocylindrales bacterium]
MADFSPEPPPDEPEEGGGPVKSFLEHLEDFRWLVIKVGVALGVCFIVCCYAVPQIVTVLKWPLSRAALFRVQHEYRTLVRLGTNTLTTLDLTTNQIGGIDLGTNWFTVVQVEPVTVGTNIFLSLRVEKNPPADTLLKSATDLIYLDPSAPFFSSMSLAFYGGILLASPFIFFFIAQFVLPALKVREKKYVLRAAFVGVGLFLAGVAFSYFFVMARALKFAEWWARWMGVKVPEWRAETYFSFVTKFLIGMGLGFELPVVLLALVKIGVLDYKKLSALRRYMVVINLVLGALLTTPEPFTQVVMAVVLQILFEISVWIAWYWERRDRKRALQAGESA